MRKELKGNDGALLGTCTKDPGDGTSTWSEKGTKSSQGRRRKLPKLPGPRRAEHIIRTVLCSNPSGRSKLEELERQF